MYAHMSDANSAPILLLVSVVFHQFRFGFNVQVLHQCPQVHVFPVPGIDIELFFEVADGFVAAYAPQSSVFVAGALPLHVGIVMFGFSVIGHE